MSFHHRCEVGRARWIRGGILLLLAVIALDLANAGCDPIRISAGPNRLASPGPVEDDACADGCVPDCFCCATALAPARSHSSGKVKPDIVGPLPTGGFAGAGFLPLPYHPPRAA